VVNILLLGHRGYLGRGMEAYLQPRHRVIGWDKEENLFNLDADFLKREEVDLLINLTVMADRGSPTYSLGAPTDEVNAQGVRYLAGLLAGTEIAWIQMSTREVLGPIYTEQDVTLTEAGYRPRFLVSENRPYAPPNFYGKSKVVAEFFSESHPYCNVIRLTTGYTDFDHPAGNWVLALIRSAVLGRPVTLTGGGLQFRDPLHVDDLGELIERLVAQKIFGQKIHAGGGEQNLISLDEFVRRANPEVAIEKAPGGDFGFAFDNAKATRLCGWEPRILVRDKIPVIADNVRRNRA